MVDSKPSKSARKREHLALQSLGEQLIDLKESELRTVPLDDFLFDAVVEAQRIKAHGALRRQKQLIGKLMGHVDPEPIRAAIALLGTKSREDKRLFANAESWRDRLCESGNEAVDEFFLAIGSHDSQVTRLLADRNSAPNSVIEKRLRRELFRRIHALLAAQRQDV